MAKTMRKKNLKIQILAGNPVNSWFSAGSQISSTLVEWIWSKTKLYWCRHHILQTWPACLVQLSFYNNIFSSLEQGARTAPQQRIQNDHVM